MTETVSQSLEQSLARTEADAVNALKAAHGVVQALKKFYVAAKLGKVKEIQTAMNEAEKAEQLLRQQLSTTKDGWDFDIDTYLSGDAFFKEVINLGDQKGMRIIERDERLFSFPVLVRVMPSEKAVRIDKVSEKRIRPSVLVNILKDMQKKPPRFRPEAFLESLHDAYEKAILLKGRGLPLGNTVISLLEVYELFTLMPGQAKEYTKQEFTRDIYLLDRSGVISTKKGAKISLPAATGTKNSSRTLSIVNEHGEVKLYYGIAFTPEER